MRFLSGFVFACAILILGMSTSDIGARRNARDVAKSMELIEPECSAWMDTLLCVTKERSFVCTNRGGCQEIELVGPTRK